MAHRPYPACQLILSGPWAVQATALASAGCIRSTDPHLGPSGSGYCSSSSLCWHHSGRWAETALPFCPALCGRPQVNHTRIVLEQPDLLQRAPCHQTPTAAALMPLHYFAGPCGCSSSSLHGLSSGRLGWGDMVKG